jgi:hypothetical protein
MTVFNKVVRLRVEVIRDGLVIAAAPDKGDLDEEEALQAVEHLAQVLIQRHYIVKAFRNGPSGAPRVDRIHVKCDYR